MKKRWMFGIGVALLAFSMCGCGKEKETTTEKLTIFDTTELTTENEKDNVEEVTDDSHEAETTEATTAAPEKENSAELIMYSDKITECCNVIANFSYDEIVSEGMLGVFETINYEGKIEAARLIGYAFKDLNGDNVPELIVGRINDKSNKTGSAIYAVYTYNNGNVSLALEGWERNYYGLKSDNRFVNQASSGAAYFGYGIYKLDENNKLACEDYYFSSIVDDNPENIGFFHSKIDDWSVANAEKLDIDSDKFYADADALLKEVVDIEFESMEAFAASHDIIITEEN